LIAARVGANLADVAFASPRLFDFARVDVEAEYGKAAVREGTNQQQADVTQADDADRDGAIPNLREKIRLRTVLDPDVTRHRSPPFGYGPSASMTEFRFLSPFNFALTEPAIESRLAKTVGSGDRILTTRPIAWT
jgi:hypothetical protein